MACWRVMPDVGVGSASKESFLMSRRRFSRGAGSDVTFIPLLEIVGAPALVLHVQLGAALRDPVVHHASPRRIAGFARASGVVIRALEPDLPGIPREREHREPALVALERAIGLHVTQAASDLHRCALSSPRATLCRTALASGRGAFSPRIRAARPH